MKDKNIQKQTILIGSEGGICFTLASGIPLIISVAFSVLILALGVDGATVNQKSWYVFTNYALSTLSLLVCIFITTKKCDINLFKAISFNKFKPFYLVICLALAFGSFYGLGWINDLFIDFLSNFGYQGNGMVIPKNNGFDFILSAVIICLLPAFFEEIIFRGLIFNSIKRLGDLFCIITCGIFFSLFHKNPMQTPYQFIMGCMFALVTLKSGSIIPAMIIHFLNNFYVIVLYFLNLQITNNTVNLILGIVAIIILILSFIYLIKAKKPESEQKMCDKYKQMVDIKQEKKNFFAFSSFGLLLCLALWITNFISYLG